jgi:hypothetical protein
MTDRDHFAAAALTGLLSNIQRYQLDPLTRQAWEIADFMLRKREQTHGGCPSGLDPEADRKSVASQRCRDTGGQPFDSAPTTTDWRSHIRPPDAADREAIRKCDEAWGTDVDAEPMAWIVHSGGLRWFAWAKPADGLYDGPIIPLYRTPQACPYVVGRTTLHCSLTPLTLTDEEREAIEFAAEWFSLVPLGDTLRSLLERTK